MTLSIPFLKMNGLGNDFVVIDARKENVRLGSAQMKAIADRATGPGFDQLVMLEPSSSSDIFMRIFNADGSESGACGNATRCVAALLKADSGRDEFAIATAGGPIRAAIVDDRLVRVDMGRPRFGWSEIPLSQPVQDTSHTPLRFEVGDGRVLENPACANVGNPHCIFWVDDCDSYDLGAFGRALEHHALFPERANISLAEVRSCNSIKLRVWERGAGLTRACGTAACAVGVSAARLEKTALEVAVELPGGVLDIEWAPNGHVMMTGPWELDYQGVLHFADRFSFERAPRP